MDGRRLGWALYLFLAGSCDRGERDGGGETVDETDRESGGDSGHESVCGEDGAPLRPGLSYFIESNREMQRFQGCTDLRLDLHVRPGVTDISPLSDAVSADLLSIESPGVIDLAALSNLREVGSFWLLNSEAGDIEPLGQVRELTRLTLDNCPNLTSLDPLRHARNLEGRDRGDLVVRNMSGLTDLEGLRDWLTSGVGSVTILSNDPIDISALNVQSSYWGIGLIGRGFTRPELSSIERIDHLRLQDTAVVDLSGFDSLLQVPGRLRVDGGDQLTGLGGTRLETISELWLEDLSGLTTLRGLDGATVTDQILVDDLPLLTDASGVTAGPNIASMSFAWTPTLETPPLIPPDTNMDRMEFYLASLRSMGGFSNIAQVTTSIVVWGNATLDQAEAEAWAANHSAMHIRIGANAGWLGPDTCPWLDDGYCDVPRYCASDGRDC